MNSRQELVKDLMQALGALITEALSSHSPSAAKAIAQALERQHARMRITVVLDPFAVLGDLVSHDGTAVNVFAIADDVDGPAC